MNAALSAGSALFDLNLVPFRENGGRIDLAGSTKPGAAGLFLWLKGRMRYGNLELIGKARLTDPNLYRLAVSGKLRWRAEIVTGELVALAVSSQASSGPPPVA